MKKILVTSVGSGVGQSVVDSLKLTNKYIVIGCSNDRNVYAYHFCHNFFIVPSVSSLNYVDDIVKLCLKENIDLVIPGLDHELSLFSNAIDKFHSKGIKVIVSKPDLIDISRDKYKWYHFFKEYGCNIVPTYKLSEFKEKPDETILPAIIKPSAGSASQGITIINSLEELVGIDEREIIQPYLFPLETDSNFEKIKAFVKQGKFVQMSEISIQLIFNKDSELAGIFISKNTLKNGVPTFLDPIHEDDFEYIDEIYKYADVCKLKKVVGPVNIQGRITSKGLILFEMNMRFTGITGNRALLGFNEVDFLVDNFLGKDAQLGGVAPNKVGVRQVACITMPKTNTHNKVYTIFGAGGVIGCEFVSQVLKEKDVAHLYLICRENSFHKYLKLYDDERITVVSENNKLLPSFLAYSDYVLNFASALAHLPEEEIYQAIHFQYRMTKLLMYVNPSVIINISSQSVYDQQNNTKKDEKEKVVISTPYSFQKHIAEEFFRSIADFCPATQAISLRLSRVWGVNNRRDVAGGFFAKIIENNVESKSYCIDSPNNNTNLIDVRDVTNAIFYILKESEQNKTIPNVINLGGENLSLREFCSKVEKVLGINKSFAKFGDSDKVENSSMIDTSTINNLGWKPKYTIEETIRIIANEIQKNL